MSENKAVTGLLEEIKKLFELKGENAFKIRAFEKVIKVLENQSELFEKAQRGNLTSIPGVGKSIAEIISEFLIKGKSTLKEELLASLPPGLLELTQIPGIGPKKAMLLIEQLGIHSVSELEYACQENRLIQLKGFGAKVQDRILKEIAFRKSYQGQQRISDALRSSEKVKAALRKIPHLSVFETASIRRRCEVIGELEYLIRIDQGDRMTKQAEIEEELKNVQLGLPVHYSLVTPDQFGFEWVKSTGTFAHWKALGEPSLSTSCKTEEEFYQRLNLPWIPPEGRETGEEVSLAKDGRISLILPENGVLGVFHNHTTRSDGSNTLEEMVKAALDLKLQYIGISDHSQSAVYAQGLREESLKAQKHEIQKVQKRYPSIRIFWGIESDILADGSLDYDPETLRKFDFVVASIHSRFQMEKKAMTERVITALKNPYTTFLGHATGRLLLGRKGFEVDMAEVIEVASKNQVAIEINSNPARLDIDWRWGGLLRRNKTFVSINPDAHDTEGLQDIQYGVMMARKALMPSEQVVNSRNLEEVEQWLKSRRK